MIENTLANSHSVSPNR